MAKISKYFFALFIALVQVVAFFPLGVILSTAADMYQWKTWRVWNVLLFNVKAAAHSIADDWKESLR